MEPSLDSLGYMNVVANSIGKVTFKIFDTNGRIAKKMCSEIIAGVQKLDLNFSELSSGTYILNAFQGDVFLKSFKYTKQ